MRHALAFAAIGIACSAIGFAPVAHADDGGKTLNFTQQVQQNSEWCNAAAGASIEATLGSAISQEDFCRAEHGISADESCPNVTASHAEEANGFYRTGFNAHWSDDELTFDEVKAQIDAGHPFLAGVTWKSNSAAHHALTVYGYTADGQVKFGNSLANYQRYTTMSFADFLDNSKFAWNHGSVYNIIPRTDFDG